MLYYPDTNGGSVSDANTGYKTRKSLVEKSKPIEMIDKLKFDLAAQIC
jgi:hypothetical protein